jgi:hypothetical protein
VGRCFTTELPRSIHRGSSVSDISDGIRILNPKLRPNRAKLSVFTVRRTSVKDAICLACRSPVPLWSHQRGSTMASPEKMYHLRGRAHVPCPSGVLMHPRLEEAKLVLLTTEIFCRRSQVRTNKQTIHLDGRSIKPSSCMSQTRDLDANP